MLTSIVLIQCHSEDGKTLSSAFLFWLGYSISNKILIAKLHEAYFPALRRINEILR